MEEKNLKTFKEYFMYIVVIALATYCKIIISEKDALFKSWIVDKDKNTEVLMKQMERDFQWKNEMLRITNILLSKSYNNTSANGENNNTSGNGNDTKRD